MRKLEGFSVCAGIASANSFVQLEQYPVAPQYTINHSQYEREVIRFRDAVQCVANDLQQNTQQKQLPEPLEKMLHSHLLMVHDENFHQEIIAGMHEMKCNIEWALYTTTKRYIERLGKVSVQYLQERIVDLYDVYQRLLSHLLGEKPEKLSSIQRRAILVARDLMPSEILSLNREMVCGIVLEAGGQTSHTAILARSFNIPTVMGVTNILDHVQNNQPIIVDGNHGVVLLSPDETTKIRYDKIALSWRERQENLVLYNERIPQTSDGVRIYLGANLETHLDIEHALNKGIDCIGLFRSEFLFLGRETLPTEEEQYHAYSHVLSEAGDKPVTIRTLDIGGDKVAADVDISQRRERNPLLGLRAIRYCLDNITLFKTQLRAILRASVHGRLHIMFPMISGIDELRQAYSVLEEVKENLRSERKLFAQSIPIGTMIEIPSAALTSSTIAEETDFFSIGTNDLIQYTLAVDRDNKSTSYLYSPFHPGFLYILRHIIANADAHDIPVSVCGEMASDPLALIILLGMGIRNVSVGLSCISSVNKIICENSIEEARRIVDYIMTLRSSEEVNNYLITHMKDRLDMNYGG